ARLHDFKAALALQQKVIDARIRVLGPRHPDTVSIMINHAGTLEQTGQYAASLQELQRVLPLAREVLEKGHPQFQMALMVLAQASEGVGDTAGEVGAYRELLEMRRAQLGEGDAKTIDAAWRLSQALDDMGKSEEAARLHSHYVAPLLAADAKTLAPELAKLAEGIRKSGEEDAS
ncbi:MAG: tetratricopeptide repeat protein, partial [Pseudoxanthomonas sp.]